MKSALVAVFLIVLAVPALAQQPDGAAVFKRACANCHAENQTSAPTPATLRQMKTEEIFNAMTLGRMQMRVPLGRLPRIALASVVMALVVGLLQVQGVPIGWLLTAGAVTYLIAVAALRAVPTADLRTLVGR